MEESIKVLKDRLTNEQFIRVIGKYNDILVHTDSLDDKSAAQLKELCDQPFVQSTSMCVMPDVHAGAGCVIGLVMYLYGSDKICPNLVGVDIGCGVRVIELGNIHIDFKRLDGIIRTRIPSGMLVNDFARQQEVEFTRSVIDQLAVKDLLPKNKFGWFENSLGTLGGGNHFIEVDSDASGNKYLIIHTGSRNLGLTAAKIYQQIAKDQCNNTLNSVRREKKLIESLKADGRYSEIEHAIKDFRAEEEKKNNMPSTGLEYLSSYYAKDYLKDIQLIQEYACYNRNRIAEVILSAMGWEKISEFESVHNYIDDKMVLRKGAIAAYEDQKVIIPLNMRDGCILGTGQGSLFWLKSAPHGAGRAMSRREARRTLDMKAFENSMAEVYSSCISTETLDESPMAYKNPDVILSRIEETVKIDKIIKPVYNFKAVSD